MKTLLLLLIPFFSFGQLEDATFKVAPNDTTKFDQTVYPYTVIHDANLKQTWMITATISSEMTLSTTEDKYLLTSSGNNNPKPTVTSVVLIPQQSFPTSPMQGTLISKDELLWLYTGDRWNYFMPVNKKVNGVEFSIRD